MLLNAIALLCVVLIGFAAHRASLCNVRAVAEVMSTGRARMLWNLLQSVLWMAALTGLLVLAFGLTPRPTLTRTPIEWAALGGVIFGVGAAVNGGCSLSTLHQLADGDLGMLATLAGFVAGVWASLGLLPEGTDMRLLPAVSLWLRWPDLALWVDGLLIGWALLQLRKLWQRAQHGTAPTLFRRLLAPNYHFVPGGNDILLLGGLPTLATAAVAACVAMLLGIASILGLLRLARLPMPVVARSPEGCEDRPAALLSSSSSPSSGVSS